MKVTGATVVIDGQEFALADFNYTEFRPSPIGWVESVDENGVATVSLHRESECILTTGYEVTDAPQLEAPCSK